ncbi:unnamed protein product, partial [Ectocarpus sp. 8 AP-2014]
MSTTRARISPSTALAFLMLPTTTLLPPPAGVHKARDSKMYERPSIVKRRDIPVPAGIGVHDMCSKPAVTEEVIACDSTALASVGVGETTRASDAMRRGSHVSVGARAPIATTGPLPGLLQHLQLTYTVLAVPHNTPATTPRNATTTDAIPIAI